VGLTLWIAILPALILDWPCAPRPHAPRRGKRFAFRMAEYWDVQYGIRAGRPKRHYSRGGGAVPDALAAKLVGWRAFGQARVVVSQISSCRRTSEDAEKEVLWQRSRRILVGWGSLDPRWREAGAGPASRLRNGPCQRGIFTDGSKTGNFSGGSAAFITTVMRIAGAGRQFLLHEAIFDYF